MRVNTIGSGEDRYVSNYVYLIGSKNDKNLLWPFRGEVHIDLLNQHDDKGHLNQSMEYVAEELESYNITTSVDERSQAGFGKEKQGRRKQIKSGEAISSVRSTHLLGGSGGMPPPGKFCFFEVVSEPISAKCKR